MKKLFLLLVIFHLVHLNTLALQDSTCIRFNNLSLESDERPMDLPDKIYTEHFIIHYNNLVTLTAYANMVAAYAETSYTKIFIERGWPVPPADNNRGGDNRYDIYIIAGGHKGECIAEFDSQWQYEWAPSFIKIRNNLVDSTGELKITVSHELVHASQFAYTYRDGYPSNFWFYENCATYIGEDIYDFSTYQYFNIYWGVDPLNNPELPIDARADDNELYPYAGFIWPMFLIEFTNDVDII